MIRVQIGQLVATFKNSWSSNDTNMTHVLNARTDLSEVGPSAAYAVSKRDKSVTGLDAIALDSLRGLGARLVENEPELIPKEEKGVVI